MRGHQSILFTSSWFATLQYKAVNQRRVTERKLIKFKPGLWYSFRTGRSQKARACFPAIQSRRRSRVHKSTNKGASDCDTCRKTYAPRDTRPISTRHELLRVAVASVFFQTPPPLHLPIVIRQHFCQRISTKQLCAYGKHVSDSDGTQKCNTLWLVTNRERQKDRFTVDYTKAGPNLSKFRKVQRTSALHEVTRRRWPSRNWSNSFHESWRPMDLPPVAGRPSRSHARSRPRSAPLCCARVRAIWASCPSVADSQQRTCTRQSRTVVLQQVVNKLRQ